MRLVKHPCAVYNTDILTYPSAAAAKLQSFQQQKLQTCMTEFPFEVIRVEGWISKVGGFRVWGLGFVNFFQVKVIRYY